MKSKTFLEKEKGFSIIEAMVAMALLSVGFVGVYALIGASERFQVRTVERNNASMLTVQMFEVIEASRQQFIDTVLDVPFSGTVNLNAANCAVGGVVGNNRPTNARDFNAFFSQWCQRLNRVLGAAGQGDQRQIQVVTGIVLANGAEATVVTIILNDGNNIAITEVRLL